MTEETETTGPETTGPETTGPETTGAAAPPSETWPEYLRRVTGGATQAQIAERVGLGRLSVCNWLHGKTQPKAETVITVARALGRPPIEALVAAGYLGAADIDGKVELRASLADVDGQALGVEVLRRLTA